MRVLVTRPKQDAERTAAKLRALGHEAVVESLFSIESIKFDVPEGSFSALAATSANALRAAAMGNNLSHFYSLPFYAVGGQTADVARETGFEKIEIADGDVRSLAKLLLNRLPRGARVFYLAGENRAEDISALVSSSGIIVVMQIVYRARATDHFSAAIRKKLVAKEIDAVLHYSPRAAETFLALANHDKLEGALVTMDHLCLSAAVAAPLLGKGANVRIAAEPNEPALFALLAK